MFQIWQPSAVEPGWRTLYLEATMGRDGMADKNRSERLKAALRENLKRRKAQARGRERPGEAPDEGAPGTEPLSGPKPRAD
jgi:hypothetical protein